jgi:hypothetical protein
MKPNSERLPPIVRLKFNPGETIIKGGDYGISMYQIVEGKVEIYLESGNEEICLAELGPGEMIGEMTFLTGGQARRSASARAVEYTVLEALHPARVQKEFGAMPLILKRMAAQLVKRLNRINKMVGELEASKNRKAKKEAVDPWAAYRKYYRKQVDIECMYRPAADTRKLILWGRIRDISKSGIRLEVPKGNLLTCAHAPGDSFAASAFLPTGKQLDVFVEVVRCSDVSPEGKYVLGMKFYNLNEYNSMILGFFLMP